MSEVRAGDILRGLVDKSIRCGLAQNALTTAGVDLAELRSQLNSPSGADGRQVADQARAEARRRGDRWIGTEHLLIATVRLLEGPAEVMLTSQGISAARVEHLVDEAIAEGQQNHPPLMRKLGAAYRAMLEKLCGRS